MTHHVAVDTNHKSGFWASKPGYKPILLLIAALVFTGVVLAPPPQSMIDLAGKVNPAGYKLGRDCKTITDTVNQKLRPDAFKGATAQGKQGHSEAEPLLSKALASFKVALDEEHPARLWCMVFLGWVYNYQHRFPEAEELFKDGLDAAQRNRDTEQSAIAQTPTNETVKAHIHQGTEDLEVVGESAYQDVLWIICGGRKGDQIRCPTVAVLVPEPTNPYDANAISVLIDGSNKGRIATPGNVYVPVL